MRVVIGVDGGNTKSDYVLCALDGTVRACLTAGTCSHEKLGMSGAAREMDARIEELTRMAGIERGEVGSAVFGLAGIDQRLQQQALHGIVSNYGLGRCVAVNDAFLGVKAGDPNGIGVGSVNGTGTSAAGIDPDGRLLHLGGMGAITGDDAGGGYLARQVLRAVYASVFHFAPETMLTELVYSRFGIRDEADLAVAYSTRYQYGEAVTDMELVKIAFQASSAGDGAARAIVEHIGSALGVNAAACAVRLHFGEIVPVYLIGSVWSRGRHAPMVEAFRSTFTRCAGRECALGIVEAAPVAGAALWALECATGRIPDAAQRQALFQTLRRALRADNSPAE